MKIAVIGYSGAGKSTLSVTLSAQYTLPLLHLDQVQFLPGWSIRDPEEARALVTAFMEAHDDWVIDGNYRGFQQEQRMREADVIVFLNFPRLLCLWRAWRRYCRFQGHTRPSMAVGCDEKWDADFVKWILKEGRTRTYRERYRAICRQYPDKIIVCRTRRDVRRAVKEMEQRFSAPSR